MANESWNEMVQSLREEVGDDTPVVALVVQKPDPEYTGNKIRCTPEEAAVEMDRKFYSGYGGTEGAPFILWTEKGVFFPVVYDGAEWAGWLPRKADAVERVQTGRTGDEWNHAVLSLGYGPQGDPGAECRPAGLRGQ